MHFCEWAHEDFDTETITDYGKANMVNQTSWSAKWKEFNNFLDG